MTKEKKKFDPVLIFLDIIIVVMVFVIIFFGSQLKFYNDFAKSTETFMQNQDMLSFELSNNDYASMIQGKYFNEFNENTEPVSYHKLANYVEAISKYKVYAAKGYDERAKEQKIIMDENREDLNDLLIFADKIDKKFGID